MLPLQAKARQSNFENARSPLWNQGDVSISRDNWVLYWLTHSAGAAPVAFETFGDDTGLPVKFFTPLRTEMRVLIIPIRGRVDGNPNGELCPDTLETCTPQVVYSIAQPTAFTTRMFA